MERGDTGGLEGLRGSPYEEEKGSECRASKRGTGQAEGEKGGLVVDGVRRTLSCKKKEKPVDRHSKEKGRIFHRWKKSDSASIHLRGGLQKRGRGLPLDRTGEAVTRKGNSL